MGAALAVFFAEVDMRCLKDYLKKYGQENVAIEKSGEITIRKEDGSTRTTMVRANVALTMLKKLGRVQ